MMRKLVIINTAGVCNTPLQPSIQIPPEFTPIPFSNAKSLLGNEYPYAIYDMRAENGVNFNLDAFAIVAGTIQRGGTLYLRCSDWENLENTVDFDSLRWNDGKAVCTPNFWVFFKALIHKYGFNIPPLFSKEGLGEIWQKQLTEKSLSHFGYNDYQISPNPSLLKRGTVLTEEQAHILECLPIISASIHLITAPRGRGKSTLAGWLAKKIAQSHQVIITARAKSALPNFWKQIENQQNIAFFAPDVLMQAIENGENFAKSWLFIDEAASLPLPILQTLCKAFGKVVMTTTTQNYEGTGRGFELKLPKMLNKPFKYWTLSQPLRWGENDPLENFVNDLLLLDNYRGVCHTPLENTTNLSVSVRRTPLHNLVEFYDLLSTAHYKTTPTDLRRLFDGENQQLFEIRENHQLIAVAWGIMEGGLDENLTQAIWRGERRPKGNLVAQYLCFQGNLLDACRLRSLRISRIAVMPEKQGKGYGKRLISDIILQISAQNPPLDFLSVSFGMSNELLKFWQRCGFRLVQISQNPEASSGLHSAMMIYPLSEAGLQFTLNAETEFKRHQQQEMHLTEFDWRNLTGFAYANRSLSACEMSLKRLAAINIDLHQFLEQEQSITQLSKQKVNLLRHLLQNLNLFPK